MPAPNPYTFPLVAYPGPAPEDAPRPHFGGWDAFALPTRPDRLPPFVLARAVDPAGSAWVNCARIEHADTGAVLVTLVPTGGTSTPPALGLVLRKYAAQGGVEYFAYLGGVIPGLALACGTPARLVLDNGWQSPRFAAVDTLDTGFLALEWHHPRPLAGVPYGAGLVQQLYLKEAVLAYLDPRTERVSTKNPDTGAERLDSESVWPQRALNTAPLPAYLAEALSLVELHDAFTVAGEPWRVVSGKAPATGVAGGRYSAALTLESLTPALRGGCGAPVPTDLPYDPVADAPRPWRCGDTSDTAPDFQPNGNYVCELDTGGFNTGYASVVVEDINQYSTSFGATSTRPGVRDAVRCPLPYRSAAITETVFRNNCAPGLVAGSVEYSVPAGFRKSAASQQAADDLARAYFDANKQAYANANASCYNRQVSVSVVEQPGGAFLATFTRTDTMGDLRIDYSVDRDDGTGGAVHYDTSLTILDGQTQAARNVAPPASTYALVDITATDPADYTIV